VTPGQGAFPGRKDHTVRLATHGAFAVARARWSDLGEGFDGIDREKRERTAWVIVHERKTAFGWADDNGLGDVLIRQIIAGLKTATCSPKEDDTAEEVRALYARPGQLSTVVDKDGVPRCTVRTRAVYDTPFGRPSPQLVRGEGNGEDGEAFKRDHHASWDAWLATLGRALTDETVLVVQEFELVEVAE